MRSRGVSSGEWGGRGIGGESGRRGGKGGNNGEVKRAVVRKVCVGLREDSLSWHLLPIL